MPGYSTYNDAALLDLLKSGDTEAFTEIYERYWEGLYDKAWQRLKNSQQVEDILQEVFLKFWQRREELSVDNLPAYLHTAVKFKILNYFHRDLARESMLEPFETIIQPGSCDSLVREKDLYRLLELYIASLPAKRREIFLLYLNGQLTAKEIAEQLDISTDNVQNQLRTSINGFQAQIATMLALVILLSQK